jgi:hypothetical protein
MRRPRTWRRSRYGRIFHGAHLRLARARSRHFPLTRWVSQVYNAIGSTAPLHLKRRVLQWALDEIKLQVRSRACPTRLLYRGGGPTVSCVQRAQDFFYAVGSVSSSSLEGLELAWDFYKQNFSKLR